MKNLFFLLLFLCFSTIFFSCSRDDDQREFEQEAYRTPSGITETTPQGQVVSRDEDDWRTSPLFQGLIEINPPFPNPSNTTSAIQFEVDVIGEQAIQGLEVVVFFDEYDPTYGSNTLYFDNETLHMGYDTFQINPLELGEEPIPESVRGIHRVFIYDGRGRMISYGDIEIE